jgi:hypothetical protein
MLNPNDNVPLPFIEISELDDEKLPPWFELKSAAVET